ncbi:MAG: hypothetical protein HYY35_04240 [Deltaproteobacteria bacterium]|nr:hypothetical protein [Deltaproteobacteria bacterium]
MIDFGDARFRDRLQEALSAHQGFAQETRWFDGSILLEADESRCWLKVYRGRIIETLDAVPPFGSTFRLRGSRQAWQELACGERRFADLIMPGQRRFANDPSLAGADAAAPARIAIEGNLLEAMRVYEALFHLADCVVQIAK